MSTSGNLEGQLFTSKEHSGIGTSFKILNYGSVKFVVNLHNVTEKATVLCIENTFSIPLWPLL